MPENSKKNIADLMEAIDDVQSVLDAQLFIECLTDWLEKDKKNPESQLEKDIQDSCLRILYAYHEYKSDKKLRKTLKNLNYLATSLQYEGDYSA